MCLSVRPSARPYVRMPVRPFDRPIVRIPPSDMFVTPTIRPFDCLIVYDSFRQFLRSPASGSTPSGSIVRSMARTAKEQEIIMARNMMSKHTDMLYKYCGHTYDIHLIQHLFRDVFCTGFEQGERPFILPTARPSAHKYVLPIVRSCARPIIRPPDRQSHQTRQ